MSRLKLLLPYGLIPLAVFVNFRQALTFHFWTDDWSSVGPLVARDFLAHPLGVFTSLQVWHYAPLARLWYALESVLFRDNPFPYHLLNLILLSISSILLYRLLRIHRFSAFPAFAGGVYFGSSVTQNHNAAWITGSNYYLLAIPFILALMCWENYLHQGRRKDLVLTLMMVLSGQFVHSLGAILPFLLLLRYHLSPREERKLAPSRVWRAAGLLLALVLVLNLGPRHVFSLKAPAGQPFHLLQLAEALWYCLARQVIPSLWGDYGLILSISRFPAARVLMAVSGMLFLAWLFRPRRWRVFLLGLAIAVLGWTLPLVLAGWTPGEFFLMGRYMIIPNLGMGLCLAVIISGALSYRGRWTRPALALGAALFVGLFLVQNRYATGLMYADMCAIPDRWVDQVAGNYRKTARRIAASSPCPRVVVVDRPLATAWPGSGTGRIPSLVRPLDHAIIHRFYFADDEEMLRRFVFVKDRDEAYRSGVGPGCVLTAFGGGLSAGDAGLTGEGAGRNLRGKKWVAP